MKKRIFPSGVIAAVVITTAIGCGVFFPAASADKNKVSGFAVEVRCGATGAGSGRGLIDDGNVVSVSVEAKDSGGNVIGTGDLVKEKNYWAGRINVAATGLVGFHAVAKGLEDAVLYTGWSTVTISEMNRTVMIAMTSLSGLVGEWLFSGDAADTSGNGAGGTVVGATLATDRFGNSDSAYSFNGDGAYIQAAADSLPTAARTVSLWFYANDISGRPYIIGYGGGQVGESWIEHINHQLLPNTYAVHCHGFNGLLTYTYSVAPENRWVHWVITTDASGTKMYVDGVLVAENTTYINNTVVAGKSLIFGALVTTDGTGPYTDINGSWLNGRLDDIRIYNRALTAAQISDLYHEGGWPLPGSRDASFGTGGTATCIIPSAPATARTRQSPSNPMARS